VFSLENKTALVTGATGFLQNGQMLFHERFDAGSQGLFGGGFGGFGASSKDGVVEWFQIGHDVCSCLF
jgi:hypothetical protein